MTEQEKVLRAERNNLEQGIIDIYGYESPITIQFFHLSASYDLTEWNNKILSILIKAHQDCPIEEEPIMFETSQI